MNVSARFSRAQASFFLYTTHGDGNYATIELEEQREYKNDRDCIRRAVKELHEEDANGERERERETQTRAATKPKIIYLSLVALRLYRSKRWIEGKENNCV